MKRLRNRLYNNVKLQTFKTTYLLRNLAFPNLVAEWDIYNKITAVTVQLGFPTGCPNIRHLNNK